MSRPAPAQLTMSDVARAAGVSKMTVSRALSGRGGVSEATRRRVERVAQDMGYEYNQLAGAFFSNRSGMIGVAFAMEGLLGSDYFARIIQGAQRVLAPAGRTMALFDLESERYSDGPKIERLIRQRRVDGLIVVAPHVEALSFTDLQLPVAIIGARPEQPSLSWFCADNATATLEIMTHLYERGHRRIAYLDGRSDVSDAADRRQAFLNFLRRRKLQLRDEWIAGSDFSYEGARRAAQSMLQTLAPPTAIVAANDCMALAVIDTAHSMGLKIPQDLSVVGFDDSQLAEQTDPPLTSARQPLMVLGSLAARAITAKMDGELEAPPSQALPMELIVRGSTGPAPQG